MGVLLFELLAGRRPFVADTRPELLRAHLISPVPRLASVRPELRVSPALAELIDIAMAKEPGDRYQTAGEMLEALDAIDPPLAWLVPLDQISEAPTQYAGEPVARPRTRAQLRRSTCSCSRSPPASPRGARPDLPRMVAAHLGITSRLPASRRAIRGPSRRPSRCGLPRHGRARASVRSTRQIRRSTRSRARCAAILAQCCSDTFHAKGWLSEALRATDALRWIECAAIAGCSRTRDDGLARDDGRRAAIIQRYYGGEAEDALRQDRPPGDEAIAQLRLCGCAIASRAEAGRAVRRRAHAPSRRRQDLDAEPQPSSRRSRTTAA
jgi:hypothetical protein